MPKMIPVKNLTTFCIKIFKAMGFSDDNALTASKNLLNADLRGVDSHGIARLHGYFHLWKSNRINPDALPKIIHQTPSTATIDADKSLGLIVGKLAMNTAINKAKDVGSSWVAVQNSSHFGIAANYAMMALEEDMIGIAMTNASALVAPTFSKSRMLGTNPIAFAIPAGKHQPFVADMATTTAANGKLELLQRSGKETPDGWVIDKNGNTSNNASILKEGGLLLPLGGTRVTSGHKGYALGSIVDILSGVLSGASFGPWAPPFPSYIPMPQNMPGKGLGHFFGAMRIDAFQPKDQFLNAMDIWIDAFKNSKRIDESVPVLIPGEPENQAFAERSQHGIPVQESVVKQLIEVATALNVNPNFLDHEA